VGGQPTTGQLRFGAIPALVAALRRDAPVLGAGCLGRRTSGEKQRHPNHRDPVNRDYLKTANFVKLQAMVGKQYGPRGLNISEGDCNLNSGFMESWEKSTNTYWKRIGFLHYRG
jgi:hypothetical protein